MAIKISWNGDTRTKFHSRHIEVIQGDGHTDEAEAARAALSRQKTNMVIETEEEAQAILNGLERLRMRIPAKGAGTGRNGCTWMTNAHMRAYNRVYDELVDELREREWCGYEPLPETSQQECPTGECNSVVFGEVGEEKHCVKCDSMIVIEG